MGGGGLGVRGLGTVKMFADFFSFAILSLAALKALALTIFLLSISFLINSSVSLSDSEESLTEDKFENDTP